MKCKNVVEVLNRLAPESLACSWDNVGLSVGRLDKNVSKILVALEVTGHVIQKAIEEQADMIITHHPLIFQPQKKINSETALGRMLLRLMRYDISCYAMHTNFDAVSGGMADLAAERLGLKQVSVLADEQTYRDADGAEKLAGIGRVGVIGEEILLQELCTRIKKKFGVQVLSVYAGEEKMDSYVSRVAIVPGSGRDYIPNAIGCRAEVFITGDVTHHVGLEAAEEGIILIDAGHYRLEHIFVEFMEQYLNKNVSADVDVITVPTKNPFVIL